MRRVLFVVCAAIAVVCLAYSAWLFAHRDNDAAPPEPTPVPATTMTTPQRSAQASPIGIPQRLHIPSIGLDHAVVAGGLTPQGVLEPKPGTVQWYNATAAPGTQGRSVVVGHVTYDGPDVFVNLHKMKPGQRVSITTSTGKHLNFEVTRTQSVDKEALRQRQDVWGHIDYRELVLITCDASTPMDGVHHVNNFVVWAKPVR